MPKLKPGEPPKYRRHKSSGRGYAVFDGRPIYFGPHGTAASRRHYHAVVAKWIENECAIPATMLPALRNRSRAAPRPAAGSAPPVTVKHVVLNFLQQAVRRYKADEDGVSREVEHYRAVSRLLVNLYGDVPAEEFGPLKLAEAQGWMIRGGWSYRDPAKADDPDAPLKVARPWCRNVANRHLGRIKYLFKKAVAAEMIPSAVCDALDKVEGLRAGQTEARETKPVKPVAEAHVEQAAAFMPPPVAAMVRLQLVTGMRPGEVVLMRGCDLDVGGRVWTYQPRRHKNEHRGQSRHVHLGPEAQSLVRPFLRADLSVPLFSPRDAEAWRLARRHEARRTPENQGNRPGYGAATRDGDQARTREPGAAYTVASYRRCIDRACARAFPHPTLERGIDESAADHRRRISTTGLKELAAWRKAQRFHPHQSRHTAATRIAKKFRLEVAQAVLGHKCRSTTERYAELADDLAREAMERAG